MNVCIDRLDTVIPRWINNKAIVSMYIPFRLSKGSTHLAGALTWLYPQRGNQSQDPMMDSFLCCDQNEPAGYFEVEEAR